MTKYALFDLAHLLFYSKTPVIKAEMAQPDNRNNSEVPKLLQHVPKKPYKNRPH